MAKLFEINSKTHTAIPTEYSASIWYLKNIIDKHGDKTAGKLFYYFHCMYDLNPDTNPFAELAEDKKSETIIRACFPDITDYVDLEDGLIIQALDLVSELYETPSYKMYKGLKGVMDKMAVTLEFAYVDVTKSEGNSGELKKLIETYDMFKQRSTQAFKEMMEDMNVEYRRGGRKNNAFIEENDDL